jgi:hypothetical protein
VSKRAAYIRPLCHCKEPVEELGALAIGVGPERLTGFRRFYLGNSEHAVMTRRSYFVALAFVAVEAGPLFRAKWLNVPAPCKRHCGPMFWRKRWATLGRLPLAEPKKLPVCLPTP